MKTDLTNTETGDSGGHAARGASLLAVPAAADAAIIQRAGPTIYYTADQGERNDVLVSLDTLLGQTGLHLHRRRRHPIGTGGDLCELVNGVGMCPSSGVSSIVINVRDKDDTIHDRDREPARPRADREHADRRPGRRRAGRRQRQRQAQGQQRQGLPARPQGRRLLQGRAAAPTRCRRSTGSPTLHQLRRRPPRPDPGRQARSPPEELRARQARRSAPSAASSPVLRRRADRRAASLARLWTSSRD